LKLLSLATTPDNIAVILKLDTTLTASEKIDSLSYTKKLLQIAIPEAGIPVGGIFSLDATCSLRNWLQHNLQEHCFVQLRGLEVSSKQHRRVDRHGHFKQQRSKWLQRAN